MTRIVAGFAGSLPLAVPRTGTRPTSDRVREAIFSALDARDIIRGTRVLDLYAGSGALGLEAASRGARIVTLVENGFGAAALCRKNAEAVLRAAPKKDAPKIKVTAQAVQSFLASTGDGFDLVFLDPPYDLPEAELGHNLAALTPLLDPDALVVVERSSRSPEPEWGPGLEADRRKDYGDTTVWYASLARPATD
ncbi:16S rRNA (guanine(966)-N(2))-methyltransferase RsmD [Cryobacterium sp. TMT1-21]|uniref:16S rRNA (Guanine(966)-N(2))-methyltransferase RsmD n=1 Tax=Cryobacterium shii TaxID=1259235 RepID=A0AAQ2HDU4_9MICO|nr:MULTISPECIES: 16S rRNA (guanine(966)-N(2))-methyltransferase RsmD [Cryobacterium]TFC40982.1 16S rRNA (guanine(966)-N(2))-methyltransferase RsmD [Cryobacterium shii]TFC87785.1 16S rRNA (guanine(966)-N(2))-methyltransferase RsmD [Cryobacterium sp. TmT2-59]TFD12459.1 16S rRNA (guanine(966)-N(2))-methyltransferase RsmD [Cryobacterium sp. TMT1-21]TFD19400.1 16S rRNA (guanine(966)-N(2))-methyltransferase RsmD [Cryobacterium sp. TMT2-23]TFD19902.1 16S rRNA (guanine(966)-N(2))-methyltransferase Rsm